MIVAITIFYIIPAILSVFVIIHKEDEVIVGELIFIVLLSLLPIVNMFAGYVCGFISLCESKKINDFLNKRIK
jgi:hypothetical protein